MNERKMLDDELTKKQKEILESKENKLLDRALDKMLMHEEAFKREVVVQNNPEKTKANAIAQTKKFIERVKKGEIDEDFHLETMALISAIYKEMHPYKFDLRPSQKKAAISAMYETIVELGTGEGKTDVAPLYSYANAIIGNKVHVVTTNDYLAKEAHAVLSTLFDSVGLTTACVVEDDEKADRKEKYQADIVWVGVDAVQFDYLSDTLAKNVDELVLPDLKNVAALVDEADSIFIDSARTPHIISGSLGIKYEKDMTVGKLAQALKVSKEEFLEKIEGLNEDKIYKGLTENSSLTYNAARTFAARCYNKDLHTSDWEIQITSDFLVSEYLLSEQNCYDCKELTIDGRKYNPLTTFLDYKAGLHRRSKDKETYGRFLDEIDRGKLLVRCEDSEKGNKYALTERGITFVGEFYFFNDSEEFKQIRDKYKDQILATNLFVEGTDYVITNDRLIFSPFGAAKAAANNITKKITGLEETFNEFENMRGKYMGDTLNDLFSYVDKSLKAHIDFEKGTDYIIKNGKVTLISTGRTAERSQLTEGLHQAIEVKEAKVLKKSKSEEKLKFNATTKSVAQITQKSFFGKYKTWSGMTGTSSEKGFSRLYNRRTIEVAKYAYEFFYSKKRKLANAKKPNRIIKHQEAFCLSKEAKFEKIYEAILESQKKVPAQPVVIQLSNVTDSALAYQYVMKKLTEDKRLSANIKGRLANARLLNATNEKEAEAEVIALAGLPGAITFTTEMAGRGTDIKLGGNRNVVINKLSETYGSFIKDDYKIIDEAENSEMKRLGRILTTEEYNELLTKLEQSGKLFNRQTLIDSLASKYGNQVKEFYQQMDQLEMTLINSKDKRNGKPFTKQEYIELIEVAEKKIKLPKIPDEVKNLVAPASYTNLITRKCLGSLSEEKLAFDKMSAQGGVSIIGTHAVNERIDKQLEGRVGRSGAGGETRFITTREDVLRIGADVTTTNKLFDALETMTNEAKKEGFSKLVKKALGLSEENTVKKITKLIKETQERNDKDLIDSIERTQTIDKEMSSYMEEKRDSRTSLVRNIDSSGNVIDKNGPDPSSVVDQMLSTTISDLIAVNIKSQTDNKNLFDINPNTDSFDKETFIMQMQDRIGLVLDEKDIKNITSLRGLSSKYIEEAIVKHRQKLAEDPVKERQKDKEIVLSTIDRTLELCDDEYKNAKRTKQFEGTLSSGDYLEKGDIEATVTFKVNMDYNEKQVRYDIMSYRFGQLLDKKSNDKLREARIARREFESSPIKDEYGEYYSVSPRKEEINSMSETMNDMNITNIAIHNAVRRVPEGFTLNKDNNAVLGNLNSAMEETQTKVARVA